jgi:hypothetical protein
VDYCNIDCMRAFFGAGFESASTADEGEKELVADTRVIRSGSVRKQRQEIEAWGKGIPVRKIFDDVASDSTENRSSLATDNNNDNVDAAGYDSDASQAREHVKSLKCMLMSNILEIGKKLIPRLRQGTRQIGEGNGTGGQR